MIALFVLACGPTLPDFQYEMSHTEIDFGVVSEAHGASEFDFARSRTRASPHRANFLNILSGTAPLLDGWKICHSTLETRCHQT